MNFDSQRRCGCERSSNLGDLTEWMQEFRQLIVRDIFGKITYEYPSRFKAGYDILYLKASTKFELYVVIKSS